MRPRDRADLPFSPKRPLKGRLKIIAGKVLREVTNQSCSQQISGTGGALWRLLPPDGFVLPGDTGRDDSLLQGLIIPAVGPLRGPESPVRLILESLRTNDIVSRLQEQRLDFGFIRADAMPAGLKSQRACTIKYAVVVPERLVPQRGMLTLKEALVNCPHAALLP